MKQFYIDQYKFYFSYTKKQNEYERCGFNKYPHQEYNTIVKAIEKINIPKDILKIIDIGCGNGLLLRHICMYSNKKVIPYGIDFLSASIKEARQKIHPQYPFNFSCLSAMDYKLQEKFDVVLLDPCILKVEDRTEYFRRIKKAQIPYCILYTYADVLRNLNCKNVNDLLYSCCPFAHNLLFTINTQRISLSAMKL